jgi:hypothetical protein
LRTFGVLDREMKPNHANEPVAYNVKQHKITSVAVSPVQRINTSNRTRISFGLDDVDSRFEKVDGSHCLTDLSGLGKEVLEAIASPTTEEGQPLTTILPKDSHIVHLPLDRFCLNKVRFYSY